MRRDLAIIACAIAAGTAAALGSTLGAALLGVTAVTLTLRGERPIPLALTALIAAFSATTALAFSNGHNMAKMDPKQMDHMHMSHMGHMKMR